MVETGAIPLVVLSRQQDPVEIINSTLRNAGHPVHCTWVRDVAGLGDALTGATPQLVFLCVSDTEAPPVSGVIPVNVAPFSLM